MVDKFDKPTDQWIDEEVDVHTFEPEVNEIEKRVEFKQTVKKVKQRTYYADSKPTTIVCNDHTYSPIDKGKYSFGCINCTWSRIAFPHTYKFDPETGKLTHRKTGKQV